jgi:hypothetical protein
MPSSRTPDPNDPVTADDKKPLKPLSAKHQAAAAKRRQKRSQAAAWRETVATSRSRPAHAAPTPSVTAGSDPQHRPAITSITKTTYNQALIHRLVLVATLLTAAGLGLLAWQQRQVFMAMVLNPAPTPTPVYQLVTSPEQLDQQRLAKLPIATASAGQASSSASASASAVAIAGWQSQPTGQLLTTLRSQIGTLRSQGIITTTLVAYENRATAAMEKGDQEMAKNYLLEGLQLAVELQSLHDYYQ